MRKLLLVAIGALVAMIAASSVLAATSPSTLSVPVSVCFGAVSGYTAPSCQTVTGTYSAITPTPSPTPTLSPTLSPTPSTTPSTTPSPSPSPSPPSSTFLAVSGANLTYNGQTVVLRGENFNNEPALACCGGPNINAINANAADYNKVSSSGGNMVRFGLDYQWYSSNRANFYAVLDQHVAWAKAAHLWMIPVMYMPPGGSSGGYGGQTGFWGSQANMNALTAFWQDFATHYASNPTIAGYDIFNEPAPPTVAAWDTFAQTTYNAIAAVDPNHFVAPEESSANWNLPSVSGSRILWSSHCYGVIGTNGCNFPGNDPSNPPKRPFWVGEFGAQYSNLGPVAGDISGFNSRGVSWTHFVMHEGGFGLYQTYGAGDFSSPWQAMIDIVSAGTAGSVKP